jgi:hypothetical protein
MCQITWTETVRGVERFAFEHDFPIELRFGMHIEPAFWTSAEHIAANLVFQVFHRHLSGEVLRYNHLEQLSAADLPRPARTCGSVWPSARHFRSLRPAA